MLYVFHMERGVMVMYDMAFTQRTVEELQEQIAKDYRVPLEQQVLLMCGGVVLASTEKVSHYNAGTESNPIFLFKKPRSDSSQNSMVEMHELSDDHLQDELDNALLLPVSFDTVQNRANLAQSFEKTALNEVKIAELLLHEHHLCHQGFGAVIANLEELEGMLKRHAENFIQVFDKYSSERGVHQQTLERVQSALTVLQKIPFLTCLGQSEEQQRVWDSQTQGRMPDNLFQWIDWQLQSSGDGLADMLEQCHGMLEELNESKKAGILSELQQIEQMTCGKPGRAGKEMKGLQERLIALELMIRDMRTRSKDQTTLRESFESNLHRVVSTKDPSVLPDLCHSHKSQLTQMSKVHQAIVDHSNKLRSSKQDMCSNINYRLRWVVSVEQRIQVLYAAIFVVLENIHKLERRLQLMEQVITAPVAFARIVMECHRRRQFASKFTEWAGDLSTVSSTTITAETERREKFAEEIGNHFITALFPGLTDVPPRYSATPPEPFDHLLPPISEAHLQQLASAIPEFTEILNTPLDLSGIESLLAYAPCRKCCPEQPEISPLFSMAVQGTTSSPATLAPSAITCSYPDMPPMSGSFPPQDRPEGEGATARLPPAAPRVGEGVEVLQSSGEKSKSQDSVRSQELLSAHHAAGKGRVASSDTSPELGDASGEFQTADFYIDESMPSSMAGSPPHAPPPPASQSTAPPDKSEQEARLAAQLQSCEGRLASQQTQYSALQSKLQVVVRDWRESQRDIKVAVQEDLRVMRDNVSLYCSQLQCSMNHVRAEVSRQKAERAAEVETQMAAKDSEIQQLQERVAETQSQYENFRAESERKTEIEQALQQELGQARQRLVEREQELLKQHSLEMELECEKLQHDHQTQVTVLENQLCMQARQAELLQEDKDRLEQEMQTQRKALQMAEHSLALRRKGEDENAELRESLEQATQQMQQEKARLEEQHHQVLATVQEELRCQREQADCRLRDVEEEHQKALQAKDSLMAERLAEALAQECMKYQAVLQEREEHQMRERAEEQGRLQEKEQQLQEQVQGGQAELEARQRQLEEKEKQHLEELGLVKEELERERTAAVREAEVQSVLQTELVGLRARLAELEGAQTVTPLTATPHQAEAEVVTKAVEEALEVAGRQHQAELEAVQGRLAAEHAVALDELKLAFQAERQEQFNQAIQQVIQDKERQLEEVRAREQSSAADLESLLQKLQAVEMEKSKAEDVKDRALSLLQEKEREFSEERRLLEEERRRLEEQMLSQSQAEGLAQSQISLLQQSALGTLEGDVGKIQQLEQSLRLKDEEVTKLQKQIMEMSTTSASGTTAVTHEKPKVSIYSPDVGSLVLLCYEENYRQYIAFTVGTVCFFVHSESLADLGLTLDPSNQNRKKWVLAEVSDKEYCQAKKPNNRFNVPVGTKFYRIRARPWKLEVKGHHSKPSSSSQ